MSNTVVQLPVSNEHLRRRFLGGSDAAAIIGVSPWRTALEVYYLKRGEADPDPREDDPAIKDLLETGKEMEPVIVNRLVRRYGVKVTKRSTPEKQNRYNDPEHPFLAAEIDFEFEVTPDVAARFDIPKALIGTIQNGEAKKVHRFATDQFGEAETEEVPVQYATQATHGLMVTGRKLCLFAVQLGDDLSVYWVYRQDDLIKPLRERLVSFWNQNVIAGIPPEPRNLPDVLRMFRRAEAPIVVEGDEAMFANFVELEKAKDAAKAASERVDEMKFELGKAMLGADAIDRKRKKNGTFESPKPTPFASEKKHMLKFQGSPRLTIALERQNRLDNDAVREKHPAVAAECSKEVTFFKFREPTKNEKLLG